MAGNDERPAWQAQQCAANNNDPPPHAGRATPDDVRHLFGELEDRYVAEILRTNPTTEALDEVCA